MRAISRRRLSSSSGQTGRDAADLLALLAATTNLDSLIGAAFAVLQRRVDCDFASAFYTACGDGFLKERDSRGREYSGAFMRRYLELTPAAAIAAANRGVTLIPTRTGLPFSDAVLKQTAFYREIMQPQGWRHAVALCFWSDPPGESPRYVTSVFRAPGRPDFSASDRAALERVHPFIDCAVRRVYERAEGESWRDGVRLALDDHASGLAFLDWQLRLVQANRVARRVCDSWHQSAAAPRDWLLPEPIANACHELRSEWREALHANSDALAIVRRRTVMHPGIAGLDAVVSMVPAGSSGLGDPSFVIAFQQRSVLNGLTAAERAAAIVVGEGVSNQEIADRLGKSVPAVKFLLHRVYQKTGVANRAALVSMLRTGAPPAAVTLSNPRPASAASSRSTPGTVP